MGLLVGASLVACTMTPPGSESTGSTASAITTPPTPEPLPTGYQPPKPPPDIDPQAGASGHECLPAGDGEGIRHCNDGLGCNMTTLTCQECGGDGEPCCDGLDTSFGTHCAPGTNCTTAPVCGAGTPGGGSAAASCDLASHTCVYCGGIDQPACTSGAACQPGLQADPGTGTCERPPAPDLTLASVNVTGPLLLQDEGAWTDCNVYVPIDDTLGYKLTLDCPWSASVRRWTTPPPGQPQGPTDGFVVTDALASQSDFTVKYYVPESTVDLHANVSFADDSSAASFSLYDQKISQSCTHTWSPGALEGNHAHYTVTVQHWVPDADLASCPQPPPQQDPDFPAWSNCDHSPTNESACDAPTQAVPHPTGCWQDLGQAQTDLYGPDGAPAGTPRAYIAPPNGVANATLSVPVSLPNVANYVRYVVSVWEGDTRIAAANGGSGWSWTHVSTPREPICPTEDTTGLGDRNTYWVELDHATQPGAFAYSYPLTPFEIVVLPQAMAQAKVLPYTLIYAPPGNQSKASYSLTQAFSIGMAFDSTVGNSQSNTVDNKGSVALSLGLGQPLKGLFGNGDVGATLAASQGWDQSTQVGAGSSTADVTSDTTALKTVYTLTAAAPNTAPGAGGAYGPAGAPNAEPFWHDKFVFLVHPQVGFWRFGGIPTASLVGAGGAPYAPEVIAPTVADLADCAQRTGAYANGYPIADTGDVLTPDECASWLPLDPFYGVGESLPASRNLTGPSQGPKPTFDNGRFLYITGQQYGEGGSLDLAQSVQHATSVSNQDVQSFDATVTDVLTTSSDFALNMSEYGLTGSDKVTSTETQTNGTKWSLKLQTTETASSSASISIEGLMSQTSGPTVEYNVSFYQDTVFGTFLFVDPDAPGPPPSVVHVPILCPACRPGVLQ